MCNGVSSCTSYYAGLVLSTLRNSIGFSAGNSAAGCDGNTPDNGNIPDGGIGTQVVDSGPQNPDAYIVRPDADGPPLWVEDGDTLYTDPHTTDGGDGDTGGNPIVEDSNEYMQEVRGADGAPLRCPTESALWRSGTGIFRLGDIGDRQLCYFMATDSREMSLLPAEEGSAHMPETETCYPGFINVTAARSSIYCNDPELDPDGEYNHFLACPWLTDFQLDLYPGRVSFTCTNEDHPSGFSFESGLDFIPEDILNLPDNERRAFTIGTYCADDYPALAIPLDPACNSSGYLALVATQSLLFNCQQSDGAFSYSTILRTWVDFCPEGVTYGEE